VLAYPLLSLSLMRPDPELLREVARVAQLVLVAAAAGAAAERILRPGLTVRGMSLLAGLAGLYAGGWFWDVGGWSPGPAVLGHPVLPAVVGSFAICMVLKLAALGAAGPRW